VQIAPLLISGKPISRILFYAAIYLSGLPGSFGRAVLFAVIAHSKRCHTWPCTLTGFFLHPAVTCGNGGLLHRRFTLSLMGGIVSVTLSVAQRLLLRTPLFSGHPALGSSDFP